MYQFTKKEMIELSQKGFAAVKAETEQEAKQIQQVIKKNYPKASARCGCIRDREGVMKLFVVTNYPNSKPFKVSAE